MPCCGKRISYNQTSRKVAISPNGSTLPATSTTNTTNAIPNNLTSPSTCIHVYQLESTITLAGKNYRKMKCSKCGGTKTVFIA